MCLAPRSSDALAVFGAMISAQIALVVGQLSLVMIGLEYGMLAPVRGWWPIDVDAHRAARQVGIQKFVCPRPALCDETFSPDTLDDGRMGPRYGRTRDLTLFG